MDPALGILILTVAAFAGVLATVILLAARDRRREEDVESPFAASSEGMTTCRSFSRLRRCTLKDGFRIV